MTLTRQFLLFAGVGVVGTSAHFAALLLWVAVLGGSPVSGSALGFALGATVNYLLNYIWTFRSTKSHYEAIPKFALVVVVGMAVNVMTMIALLWLGLHYLIAQVLATGIVLVWNFLANKTWTFAAAPLRRQGEKKLCIPSR